METPFSIASVSIFGPDSVSVVGYFKIRLKKYKLIDNFSEAVGAVAVAELNLVPAFNAFFANACAKAPAPIVPISIRDPS